MTWLLLVPDYYTPSVVESVPFPLCYFLRYIASDSSYLCPSSLLTCVFSLPAALNYFKLQFYSHCTDPGSHSTSPALSPTLHHLCLSHHLPLPRICATYCTSTLQPRASLATNALQSPALCSTVIPLCFILLDPLLHSIPLSFLTAQ